MLKWAAANTLRWGVKVVRKVVEIAPSPKDNNSKARKSQTDPDVVRRLLNEVIGERTRLACPCSAASPNRFASSF
jgi:hypothetical protein